MNSCECRHHIEPTGATDDPMIGQGKVRISHLAPIRFDRLESALLG